MGTHDITTRDIHAVALLARGLTRRQIALQIVADEQEVSTLLTAISGVWRVSTLSALAVKYIDRLSLKERILWDKWVAGIYTHVQAVSERQKQLLAALALKANASRTLAELAGDIGTDEKTLTEDLEQLLAGIPGVNTRAGLTTICYLAKPSIPPRAVVIGNPSKVALSSDDQDLLHLVRLVALGLGNQAISIQLGIELDTVKTHLRRLFKKLNVKNRAQLALLYVRVYMTDEERALWRSKVTFKWPPKQPNGQFAVLDCLLRSMGTASNDDISKQLFVSEDTVKTQMRRLMARVEGLPRNRQSVAVAAELHRP